MSLTLFRFACTIKDRSGTELADARIAEPDPQRQDSNAVGQQYLYDAVVSAAGRAALEGQGNRIIEVEDGRVFRVVEVRWRPIMGFLDVVLSENRANG